MSVTATISNISRSSLHDGPGLRTVVYFKGCGLHCAWCHNPETISTRPDILYAPIKCVHCGKCVALCPEHHQIQGNDMIFLREGCTHCAKCVEVCPSNALSVSGKRMDLEEVYAEVVKDLHYYQESGGGVTLSGGECLLHADFCAELLRRCKEQAIHTAMESALFVPWEAVEKVLPFCDLFFTDVKIPDPEKHRTYTGQDNRQILTNLQKLTERAPGKVLVRIPVIPGVNDSEADLSGFTEILSPLAERLQGVELLKYNSLAESKYTLAGLDYSNFGQPQSSEAILSLCAQLEEALQKKVKVFAVV